MTPTDVLDVAKRLGRGVRTVVSGGLLYLRAVIVATRLDQAKGHVKCSQSPGIDLKWDFF